MLRRVSRLCAFYSNALEKPKFTKSVLDFILALKNLLK